MFNIWQKENQIALQCNCISALSKEREFQGQPVAQSSGGA